NSWAGIELRGCQEISHTKMRRNFSQHQGRFQRLLRAI
ncbi:MAG: hypothetical protein ACI9NC_004327, partial [Verrucomicrobiales bacterium]